MRLYIGRATFAGKVISLVRGSRCDETKKKEKKEQINIKKLLVSLLFLYYDITMSEEMHRENCSNCS